MKRLILTLVVLALGVFASFSVAGACNIVFYQPELPDALRK